MLDLCFREPSKPYGCACTLVGKARRQVRKVASGQMCPPRDTLGKSWEVANGPLARPSLPVGVIIRLDMRRPFLPTESGKRNLPGVA